MIRVTEPFVAAPRLATFRGWSAFEPEAIESDRGLVEVTGVEISAQTLVFGSFRSDSGRSDTGQNDTGQNDTGENDLVEDLVIEDCRLDGVDLTQTGASSVEILRSVVDQCDLSRVTVRSIRGSRFVGAKLVGTEFSGASLTDVVFERCSFRFCNLRMATLRRVQFEDCVIDDVDAFEASMEDVDFAGSEITGFDVDRLAAKRVDLRYASVVELKGIGKLSGLLVAQHQLPGLALALANAVGLDIEASLDE